MSVRNFQFYYRFSEKIRKAMNELEKVIELSILL